MIKRFAGILASMTVAAAVAVSGPAAKAQEAGAGPSSPSFGIRPAVASAADPASFGYFIHTLDRGQRLTDQALVVNEGPDPVVLDVYVAGSRTAINGSTSFRERDADLEGAAHWITVQNSQVALDPGETQVVPFTVDVPLDAASGEHVAGLIVQPVQTDIRQETGAGTGTGPSFDVQVVHRVGVAVVVSVPGERTMRLQATDIRLDHQYAGGAVFTLSVHNIGNVMVEGSGTLTIADAAGSELATSTFDMATVLPGDIGLFYIDHPTLLGDGRFGLRASVEYRPVRGTEASRITSVTNDSVDVREGQPVAPNPGEMNRPGASTVAVLESSPGGGSARGEPGPLGIGLSVGFIAAAGAFLAIAWKRKRSGSHRGGE